VIWTRAERVDRVKIASLRRRALAGLIDGGAFIAVVGIVGAAWATIGPLRRLAEARLHGLEDKPADWSGPAFIHDRRVRGGLQMLSLVLAIVGRNGRGPGARLVGIRRVDERTGGPVTVRSAFVRYGIVTAGQRLRMVILKPLQERADLRRRALEPQLRKLREKYAADPEAMGKEMVGLYEGSCAPSLSTMLVTVLAGGVPTLLSPRNQSIADTLAGTIVVDERDAKPRPRARLGRLASRRGGLRLGRGSRRRLPRGR
jgi:uncharacterized RDD family membrane protein YckC